MTARGLVAEVAGRIGPLAIDVALATLPGTLLLVGPNGAGKSTVLRMILGAHPASAGTIALGGSVLYDSARGVDLPPERRGIGYVPQGSGLFPHLSVLENVRFALDRASPRAPRERRDADARAVLAELGVESLAERAPASLSGGERQRVAFARAIAARPRALLLDEPFSALDRRARRALRAVLAERLRSLEIPAIVVTHDPEDVEALGGEIAFLEAGRVIYRGPASRLATADSPAVADFLGLDDGSGPAS